MATSIEKPVDEIITHLYHFFTPDLFNIHKVAYRDTYYIETVSANDQCLELTFNKDVIYIESLDKCGITGSKSLELLYKFASSMPNIKYLRLADASELTICNDIRINLYIFKILCSGKSWYNSLGYISDNYNDEIKHNLEIISLPFNKVLDYCITSNIEAFQKTNNIETFTTKIERLKGFIERSETETQTNEILQKISILQNQIDNYDFFLQSEINKYHLMHQQIIKKMPKWFNVNNEMTTQEYFTKINDVMKKETYENKCDNREKYELLKYLITIIFEAGIIKYNNLKLINNIARPVSIKAGSKRSKSRTKSMSKSRTKSMSKSRTKSMSKSKSYRLSNKSRAM